MPRSSLTRRVICAAAHRSGRLDWSNGKHRSRFIHERVHLGEGHSLRSSCKVDA